MNTFDQTYLGKTIPGFYYGLNLGANYKGFDFSVRFAGVGDVQRYNSERSEMMYTGGISGNRSVEVLDSWSESNKSSSIPRIIAADPARNFRRSSRFVEDASYFRLNHLELGYTFKNIEKAGISNARLYVGGSYLFTMTDYSGLDPETYDHPTPQIWFTGFNITF